jgi:hypothetical protein
MQPAASGRSPSGESRSLVVIGKPARPALSPRHCPRPSVTFLAHLIASAQQAPQTRMRRQAEPAEVVGCYASQPAVVMLPGRSISMSR